MVKAPYIYAEQGDYRVVNAPRDDQHWPNSSDLTLEQLTPDAMGVPQWHRVYSWFVAPLEGKSIKEGTDILRVVLQLLLGNGPAFKGRS